MKAGNSYVLSQNILNAQYILMLSILKYLKMYGFLVCVQNLNAKYVFKNNLKGINFSLQFVHYSEKSSKCLVFTYWTKYMLMKL